MGGAESHEQLNYSFFDRPAMLNFTNLLRWRALMPVLSCLCDGCCRVVVWVWCGRSRQISSNTLFEFLKKPSIEAVHCSSAGAARSGAKLQLKRVGKVCGPACSRCHSRLMLLTAS
jgi:hypothetical protein